MFEFENVSKSYKIKGGRKHILKNVSFSLPEGENVAIMGNNGVGKSTMMRLMAGIEQPDRGRVIRKQRTSWPIGFTGGFSGSMTGIENVRFVARLYGQDPEAVGAYVEEFADLGASMRAPIMTYSSGMRARLAFGLSMAIDFDCYLIDEITAVGDAGFRARSKEVFDKKLAHSTVIMISHSISTIREYCARGLFLQDGSIHFYPDIEELISVYKRHAH